MASLDLSIEKGLPANPQTERLILGAVMVNDDRWAEVSELSSDVFSVEKHRRIFGAMRDLASRGDRIDRVTLSNELIRKGQLESVDGLAGINALDEGLPDIPHVGTYLKTLRQHAYRRQAIFTAQSVIDKCLIGEVDVEQALAPLDKLNQDIQWGRGSREKNRTATEIIEQYPGGVSAFLDPNLRQRGIRTGVDRLDELTNGFKPGQLWVIAGRTSHGKSAAAGNMIRQMLMDGHRCHVFSMEMSASSWIERMLCDIGNVERHKFKHGLDQEERRKIHSALAFLGDAPLTINDSGGTTAAQVMSYVQAHSKGPDPVKVIVIDHLQLMGRDRKSGYGGTRNDEVASNSRLIKLAAKDYGVVALELSQIKRLQKGGDGFPGLDDLRDSGAIEEDADGVLIMHRPGVNKPDRSDLKHAAYWVLAKQRDGELARLTMRWEGQYMRFTEAPEGTFYEV